jgi:hypothetical protein
MITQRMDVLNEVAYFSMISETFMNDKTPLMKHPLSWTMAGITTV